MNIYNLSLKSRRVFKAQNSENRSFRLSHFEKISSKKFFSIDMKSDRASLDKQKNFY